MTGLQHEFDLGDIRSTVAREARTMVPELVERITATIQTSVRSYAGPETGRRHRLIEMATGAAITHFLDAIEQPGASSRPVDELFRRMGHGEATEQHSLESMQAALRIVNREAWVALRGYCEANGWSAAVLGSLCDAVFAFTDHLSIQAQLGYDAALRTPHRDPERARVELLDALLHGLPLIDVHPLAAEAGWRIPSSFVVVGLAAGTHEALPDLSDVSSPSTLEGRYLARAHADEAIILTAPADRTQLFEALALRAPHHGVVVSWPVPHDEIGDAMRWVALGLDLVAQGVIAPAPVIQLSEHRTDLWLHSEPLLRQRLCQELLRPLLAETPNSREILSETLLAWLESRDSAPAIAARLGVHAQTVRYRWKRINELFGDDLREPEFVVQVTMLLKASVPLWKAGDQSDFERFRTEDAE